MGAHDDVGDRADEHHHHRDPGPTLGAEQVVRGHNQEYDA